MGREIERKFRIRDYSYREGVQPVLYRQGYMSSEPGRTVRVRIAGDKGFLTIKGPSVGCVRAEYEYEIPREDADEMLDQLCRKPVIEKYRYKVDYRGFLWEVDEFLGDNKGLVIAEIELREVDEEFPVPEWIGEEVTGDKRYFNSSLAKRPFGSW